MHRAAEENSLSVARLLIEHGAEVDAREQAEPLIVDNEVLALKDPYTMTPLHFAAEKNSLEVARLLIEHGADVNAKDSVFTPLDMAAEFNSIDVARLLIEQGANTNGRDLNWMDDHEDA